MTEQLQKVTGQVEKLRDIAKTTGEKAKRQFVGLQESSQGKLDTWTVNLKEKSQKTIQDVEERAKDSASRVAEETRAVVKNVQTQIAKPNFDALLSRISAKELLEKMHADELVEYGVNVRNELYEKLGVVPAEDFGAAIARIDALEATVKALSTKRAAPRKKAAPKAATKTTTKTATKTAKK